MPTRRNYLNIVQDGKLRLERNSPVNNFNPQGTAKAFLDIMAVEAEKIYDDMEYIYRSVDPTLAVGADLDKIGYLVGETRGTAISAADYTNTNFYFYIDSRAYTNVANLINSNYTYEERVLLIQNGFLINDSTGSPSTLTIPAGTVVKSFDGRITYTTINPSIISSSNEAYVGVISTGSGPSFNVQTNVLVSHSLQQVPELRKISQFIKCANRFPISNGKYSQTDEEFRYRIATARSAFRTNEISIRRAALSVPGVRDIMFEKNKYGNGTVSIIIEGVSPLISQGLIDAVKEKIQQELSYGDVIYVDRPVYLGVELNFGIVTTAGSVDPNILRQQARSAIIQYINDLAIGEEIVWNRIISDVLSINGIEDVIPTVFKYGEYDIFNNINKNQVALRFINQKAKYNQKWYTDSGIVQVCVV
jgi:uncharacterized phage protein gp47/JayE